MPQWRYFLGHREGKSRCTRSSDCIVPSPINHNILPEARLSGLYIFVADSMSLASKNLTQLAMKAAVLCETAQWPIIHGH